MAEVSLPSRVYDEYCKWLGLVHHLVKYTAEAPVVDLEAVRLAHPDLWGQVDRRPAECVGRVALLRQTEVGQFHVPVNKRGVNGRCE